MENTDALVISGLTYKYKENFSVHTKVAVKDLTLSVKAGEAFGFLGQNGAGKTTTIKCILNLVTPAAGSIRIFGMNFTDVSSRSQIGYLPEQPYFYDHLTVAETLRMFARLAGLSGPRIEERVTYVLNLLKMSSKSGAKMRSLSKGLVQRIGLAQALLAEPRLLILDEPFSGLDPIGRREFREILLTQKAACATIFMSSHILSDVEAICERVSILANGSLQGVFDLRSGNIASSSGGFELVIDARNGVPEEIIKLAAQRSSEVGADRLRFGQQGTAQTALKICVERGIPVISFERQQGSLEDLFMQLVVNSTRQGQ